jgi:DNA-binding NarL/FixJ family response regulator
MRVFLVDDEARVRSALRLILEQDDCLQVVGETGDTYCIKGQIENLRPDLLLIDWEMTGVCCHELIGEIHQEYPHVWIAAMSSRPEARAAALQSGADAFICKGLLPEQVLEVLALGLKAKSASDN